MDRSTVYKLAQEAGILVFEENSFADDMYISVLYRFAQLVEANLTATPPSVPSVPESGWKAKKADEELMQKVLKRLEEIHPGNMTPMAEEAWNEAIAALRERLDAAPKPGEPT